MSYHHVQGRQTLFGGLEEVRRYLRDFRGSLPVLRCLDFELCQLKQMFVTSGRLSNVPVRR